MLRHIPGTRAPLDGKHDWNVLIEATTSDPGGALDSAIQALLAGALAQGLIGDAVIAANEAQAEAFWRIRDSISEAERVEGQTLAHDVSVPVDAMPAFIATASSEVERAFPGVAASAFGHLGDGNVHFHVRAGSHAAPDWYDAEGAAITRLVDDLVTAAGGSISAEHGIGQLKRAELAAARLAGARSRPPRDQAGARPARHHESGKAGSLAGARDPGSQQLPADHLPVIALLAGEIGGRHWRRTLPVWRGSRGRSWLSI